MNNNLPLSIQKMVNELDSIDNVNNTIIADILSEIKFSENDFIPYQTYNHSNQESYGRKLLIDKGKFKILLMSWRPSDFTAIHNHGFTEWGIVHFFGEATHRLYENQEDSLSLIESTNFSAGQNASVYIPERKKIVVTEGSAYVKMTNDFKISEKNFSLYNIETLIDYFNLILPYYIRNKQIDVINNIDRYIKNPELFYEKES